MFWPPMYTPMAEYLAFQAFIAFSDGAVQVSNPASGLAGIVALTVPVRVLAGVVVTVGALVEAAVGALVAVAVGALVVVLVVLETLGLPGGLVVLVEPVEPPKSKTFVGLVVLTGLLVPGAAVVADRVVVVVRDELAHGPDWAR